MRAVVTGGAGFIGSHVTDALLARGDEVTVVDNLASGKRENVPEWARLVELDIRDDALAAIFDDVQPEVCFHLAAQASVTVSVEKPVYDADVNVLGTIRVLEAARRYGTKVVFSSTGGAIYGECERPATEDAPRRPASPYGAAKLSAEEYLKVYDGLHGGGHVSMRFANVYGPRQDAHGEAGVVAIFMEALSTGGQARIFGDGLQIRDYVYVEDVVEATVAAAGQDGGVFNVGTGIETNVVELYARCRRVAGVEAEPQFAPPRPGELLRSVVDPGLAERLLGWRPRHSLEDGLRATWESLSG